MSEGAEGKPVPPPEVQAQLDAVTAQGAAVKEIKIKQKSGEASAEEVQAEVDKLLALKAKVPPEFLPKPPGKEKKKKKDDSATKARAAAKEAKRLEREQAAKAKREKQKAENSKTAAGVLTETYGDLPLVMSKESDRKRRTWLHVAELGKQLTGQQVLVRGYVHTVRAQARNAFVVLRQGVCTVQCVVADQMMAKWCATLTTESIVDVEGVLAEAPEPTKTTQSLVELQVSKLFVVNRASLSIPFSVTDCDRSVKELEEMQAKAEANPDLPPPVTVGLDLKLNHRHLSLRTPAQQAIMRISSGMCHFFRHFLNGKGFTEIQTPKLLGGSSEGGAEVFRTEYFGSDACLAQSPQLHKQICAACSGLERVFEIGPVFRAENSHTGRHLCEFHGLDLEMAFNEHYHEVLDTFSDLFCFIFDSLTEEYATELKTIWEYYPAEPLQYRVKPENLHGASTCGSSGSTLLLKYKEAIALLREDGVTEAEQGDLEDFSTPVEKRLGALVKAKYGVDFYFLDKFPSEFRPFYTMPDPENPDYSNSYDFFVRGQEILSGAQRVHDPDMLSAAIAKKEIPVESLKFYIDAFRTGALPHAGGGIGLERLVMLFCGLPNIRLACFFVRDPTRLTP